MVLRLAEIIFNDSPSKYNKDMVDFMKRNIETIIMRGQIKFKFKIAKTADLSKLRNMGVKRLPAMLLDRKSFIGVPVIIAELRKQVKNSKSLAAPKSEDEVLDEYYKKELGEIRKDSDGKIIADALEQEEMEDNGDNLTSALHRELDRRQNSDAGNLQKGKRAPPPPKPSRDVLQDDDFEDRRQPTTYHQASNQRPRQDNLQAPAGDPTAALQNIQGRGGGEAIDDQLMATLLAKIGGEE